MNDGDIQYSNFKYALQNNLPLRRGKSDAMAAVLGTQFHETVVYSNTDQVARSP
jgi:hypothetical protein